MWGASKGLVFENIKYLWRSLILRESEWGLKPWDWSMSWDSTSLGFARSWDETPSSHSLRTFQLVIKTCRSASCSLYTVTPYNPLPDPLLPSTLAYRVLPTPSCKLINASLTRSEVSVRQRNRSAFLYPRSVVWCEGLVVKEDRG